MDIAPPVRKIRKKLFEDRFIRNLIRGPLPLPTPYPTTAHQLRLYFPAFAAVVAPVLPAEDDAVISTSALFEYYETTYQTWPDNIQAWHDYMILDLKPYIHSVFRQNPRAFVLSDNIRESLHKHRWRITYGLLKQLLLHAFDTNECNPHVTIDGIRTCKTAIRGIQLIK